MDMMIGVRRFLKSHKHSEFLEAESTLDTLEDSVQVIEEFCLKILQSKLFTKSYMFPFCRSPWSPPVQRCSVPPPIIFLLFFSFSIKYISPPEDCEHFEIRNTVCFPCVITFCSQRVLLML